MEEAHRRHARLPWKQLLGSSVDLAGEGLLVDWWTTLMIASSAVDLRRYPASAAAYLAGRAAAERAMGHQVQRAAAAGRAEGDAGLSCRRRPARFLPRRSGAQHRLRYASGRRRSVGRRPRLVPRSWARAAENSLSRRPGVRDAGADLRADPGAYLALAAAEAAARHAAGRMHRLTRPMRARCNRPTANACRTWGMPMDGARSAPNTWRRPAPRISRWSTARATWRR